MAKRDDELAAKLAETRETAQAILRTCAMLHNKSIGTIDTESAMAAARAISTGMPACVTVIIGYGKERCTLQFSVVDDSWLDRDTGNYSQQRMLDEFIDKTRTYDPSTACAEARGTIRALKETEKLHEEIQRLTRQLERAFERESYPMPMMTMGRAFDMSRGRY